ncbi:MAG: hypothetical protein DRN06_05290 [Thermoprotei archaeon]|nr:MAG: hypothetical protein DRN06_05290 [Thermoprotei archaeon]
MDLWVIDVVVAPSCFDAAAYRSVLVKLGRGFLVEIGRAAVLALVFIAVVGAAMATWWLRGHFTVHVEGTLGQGQAPPKPMSSGEVFVDWSDAKVFSDSEGF